MDEPGQGRGPSKVGVYDRSRGKSRALLWLVLAVAAILVVLFLLRQANAAPAAEAVAALDAPAAAVVPPTALPAA